MTDQEREEWNAAVKSGDAARIAALQKYHLTRINAKIMTEDDYMGRTKGES